MPVPLFQNASSEEWVMESYQVVISNATMTSSLMTKAVKEMDTMCKNSFSNKRRDMIMMAAPAEMMIN
jgi:hypothetical protein